MVVDDEGAWQQAGLAENLKAVADAEDQFPLIGHALHTLHDRREAGDRAAAQVIAVRKAAWEDDTIVRAQFLLLVPDVIHVQTVELLQHMVTVVIAPGSRK